MTAAFAPERFIAFTPRLKIPAGKKRRPEYRDVTYPAGLCVPRVEIKNACS